MVVACSRHGTDENTCRVLSEIQRERDHLEDVGVDWRVILKRILEKWAEKVCTGII
jgi:hypothetical protein